VKKSPKIRTNTVTPEVVTYEQEVLAKESAEIHESSEPNDKLVAVLPPLNHKKSVLPPLVIKNNASVKLENKYDADRPIFGAGLQREATKLMVEDTKEEEESHSQSKEEEAQEAFDQLRQHLQRGDTCPDLLIKSILTEIDRPQTTPGGEGGDKSDLQKQTALIAEHLMNLKGGWDEPMQREHTEMSLFSLFTRESTQLSDWPSLSRESSLGLEGSATKVVPRESVLQTKSLRPTTVTRPNAARPKVQFRHPSESSDATVDTEDGRLAEITGNVSALIKRALQQSSDVESIGSSTHPSPEGPPEPIYTENTFIFNRKT